MEALSVYVMLFLLEEAAPVFARRPTEVHAHICMHDRTAQSMNHNADAHTSLLNETKQSVHQRGTEFKHRQFGILLLCASTSG